MSATDIRTPPELLREKQPGAKELALDLEVSRYQAYGLLNPVDYRDGIPAHMFDTRSDLAHRIASYLNLDVDKVRDYYARAKARRLSPVEVTALAELQKRPA